MSSSQKTDVFCRDVTRLKTALNDLDEMIEKQSLNIRSTMIGLLRQQAYAELKIYWKGCKS